METNNESKCVKAELFYQWKGELEWKHRCIDQWMQQQQWIHEQLPVHQKELFFLELLLSLPFWFFQNLGLAMIHHWLIVIGTVRVT